MPLASRSVVAYMDAETGGIGWMRFNQDNAEWKGITAYSKAGSQKPNWFVPRCPGVCELEGPPSGDNLVGAGTPPSATSPFGCLRGDFFPPCSDVGDHACRSMGSFVDPEGIYTDFVASSGPQYSATAQPPNLDAFAITDDIDIEQNYSSVCITYSQYSWTPASQIKDCVHYEFNENTSRNFYSLFIANWILFGGCLLAIAVEVLYHKYVGWSPSEETLSKHRGWFLSLGTIYHLFIGVTCFVVFGMMINMQYEYKDADAGNMDPDSIQPMEVTHPNGIVKADQHVYDSSKHCFNDIGAFLAWNSALYMHTASRHDMAGVDSDVTWGQGNSTSTNWYLYVLFTAGMM